MTELLGKSTLPIGWKSLVRLTPDAFEIIAQGLPNEEKGHGCVVLGDNGEPVEAWKHPDGHWRDNLEPSSTTLNLKPQLIRIKSDIIHGE